MTTSAVVEAPLVRRTAGEDGVVRLTLNRGERFNLLSTAMIAAIQAELDQRATAAWLDALPRPTRRTSHKAALAALDTARGEFGSDDD